MPDLEHDLRDLLTDGRLDLPIRRDALRIIEAGVRRRRRRRTLAMAAAAAGTVGAVVAAAAALPAALSADGDSPQPAQPQLRYDVTWVGTPAPTAWSPKPVPPAPPSMDAPRCNAGQLRVGRVVPNAATGVIFTTIRLRNISSAPCLLVGTPVRVAAQATGQPDVVATRGLQLGSGGVGGDLMPGHLGYLTVETNRDCPSPSGKTGAATESFTSLSVTLPSGTSFSLPVTLNAGCGIRTGGLGIDVPPPRTPLDPRSRLVALVESPPVLRTGSAAYIVSLTNPTNTAISLRHCPGYDQDLTFEGLSVVENRFSLNCARVRVIAAHATVRYQMRVNIPVDATPGIYALHWTLSAAQPVTASSSVVVGSSRS